jgi:hypothetical protein
MLAVHGTLRRTLETNRLPVRDSRRWVPETRCCTSLAPSLAPATVSLRYILPDDIHGNNIMVEVCDGFNYLNCKYEFRALLHLC